MQRSDMVKALASTLNAFEGSACASMPLMRCPPTYWLSIKPTHSSRSPTTMGPALSPTLIVGKLSCCHARRLK